MSGLTGWITLLALITFLGIVWWAFSRGRDQANRDASMLPFDLPDETEQAQQEQSMTEKHKKGETNE